MHVQIEIEFNNVTENKTRMELFFNELTDKFYNYCQESQMKSNLVEHKYNVINEMRSDIQYAVNKFQDPNKMKIAIKVRYIKR